MRKNKQQLIREKADSIFDVFLDSQKYINMSSASGQRLVQIYYQKAMVEALEKHNEILLGNIQSTNDSGEVIAERIDGLLNNLFKKGEKQ